MSVFGALDASMDTQWIRVTPARHTILTSPDPLETTVTLERAGTDRIVELRDSIVAFTTIGGLYPEAMWYTHNYWTTEPIEPGASYTVTVTGADRPTATVTDLPIPKDYSVVVAYGPYGVHAASVRVDSVPYLGLVLVRLYFTPECAAEMGLPLPMVLRAKVRPPVSPGSYQVDDIRPNPPFPPACPIIKRDILVVASGSPWPEGLKNVPSALGVLSTPSDIENGVGFLGGVLTKTLPWQPCLLEPWSPRSGPCPLTYDSTSVTLQGRVEDALSGQPVDSAQIHLTEIIPDSSPPTKLRGGTDSLGAFKFGAVEAGERHVFRVSHSAVCNHFISGHAALVFLDHVDTLPAYAPAEHVTVDDVVLQRNPDCDGYIVVTGW